MTPETIARITDHFNQVLNDHGLENFEIAHLALKAKVQGISSSCHCDPKTEHMVLDPLTGNCKCVKNLF